MSVARINKLSKNVANEKIAMAQAKAREVKKFKKEIDVEVNDLLARLQKLKAKF